MNAARADSGFPDGSVVLRTGSRTNAAGAYFGGGTGNKAIMGVFGLSGRPLSYLKKLAFEWKNVQGPGGPYYNPPDVGGTVVPYVNLLVDFGAGPGGGVRILVLLDGGGGTVGTYTNPLGANKLLYAWDSTQNVRIVNSPNPTAAPGGVTPVYSAGPNWQANSYSFAALVAANPTAVFIDAFPSDGGMPAGAIMPALLLISGDSGTLTKSGKQIVSLSLNGGNILK